MVTEVYETGDEASFKTIRMIGVNRQVLGVPLSDLYRWEDCQGSLLNDNLQNQYVIPKPFVIPLMAAPQILGSQILYCSQKPYHVKPQLVHAPKL